MEILGQMLAWQKSNNAEQGTPFQGGMFST